MRAASVATIICVGLLLSLSAAASDYCTKEQYARDHAMIADAFTRGALFKGPKGLRDSILIQEGRVVQNGLPSTVRLHAII